MVRLISYFYQHPNKLLTRLGMLSGGMFNGFTASFQNSGCIVISRLQTSLTRSFENLFQAGTTFNLFCMLSDLNVYSRLFCLSSFLNYDGIFAYEIFLKHIFIFRFNVRVNI